MGPGPSSGKDFPAKVRFPGDTANIQYETMAGIYVHIPFCKSKCCYCDFYSCTTLAKKDAVLAAVSHELVSRAHELQGETVRTLYIGGGTPTICTPRELEGLIRTVRDTFDTQIEEITVEANPDDLTPGYLEALRGTGTNRLSIGVQSLLDRDLRWMNRRHDARQALRAVRDAQAAGFANLSPDLIYGLPQLSVEQWRRTLDDFLSLDVPHLSAYHLSVEPRTALGKRFERGAFRPAGERLSEAHYALLHAVLTGAGYRHYEISSFARPGFESRHNSSYWKGVRYLGVGPAAHSFDGDRRRWNVSDVREYLRKEPEGTQYETEEITPKDAYNEFVMTGLRTDEGIDSRELSARFGARKLQYFVAQAEKFVAQGNIVQRKSVYYIPAERYLISDSIISDLFDVE